MRRPPSPRGSKIARRLALSLLSAALLCAAKPLPLPVPISPEAVTDPVEKLIAAENAAYDEWLTSADEPPVAYVNATRFAAELYSPGYRGADDQVLCSSPDLADLMDLTEGDPNKTENYLNLGLPRVRERVGDDCLVRPGDRVVVIGRGWQEERLLDSMRIDREKPACPQDPPYSLWMTFDTPLDEEPLFATTDPSVKGGSNSFVSADQYPVASVSADTMARMKGIVQFPEDYHATLFDLKASSGLQALVLFERRTVTLEDDGLPAIAAVLVTTGAVQALWSERVDAGRGTGRLEFVGTLDFDGDGVREVVLSGVHQTCPYRMVFRRGIAGWEPLPLAVRSCRC